MRVEEGRNSWNLPKKGGAYRGGEGGKRLLNDSGV